MANTNIGEGYRPGYELDKAVSSGSLDNPELSYNPALERDVLLENMPNRINWWRTLNHNIEDIQNLNYKGQIIDLKSEYNKVTKALDEGSYANDSEKVDLISKANELRNQMEPLYQKIDSNTKEEKETPIAPSYEIKTMYDQLEENTSVKEYLGGELAQDLGGSFSELKTQAALMLGAKSWEIARPIIKDAIMKSLGKAAIGTVESGPAGPLVGAALLLGDAAMFAGGLYATYKMRQRETSAELAGAYEQRLTDIMKRKSDQKFGQPLSEYEQRDAEMEAYKGIDMLKDVNMKLTVNDYAQTMLLLAPMGKIISKLTGAMGATKIAGRIIGDGIKFPLEALSEGYEEGIQNLVAGKYQRGDYDKYQSNHADSFLELGKLHWETTKALMGTSDEQLTKTADFRNSFRSGVIIGGLMGGPMSGYESVKDYYEHKGVSKKLDGFINSRIRNEETYTKVGLITDLIDKGRLEHVHDIIDDADKFSKEITPEDKEYAQKLIGLTNAAINRIDNSPSLIVLNDKGNETKRKDVINTLVSNQLQVEKANDVIKDLNKQSREITNKLASEQSEILTPDQKTDINDEITNTKTLVDNLNAKHERRLAKHDDEVKLKEVTYAQDIFQGTQHILDKEEREAKKSELNKSIDKLREADDNIRKELQSTHETTVGALEAKAAKHSFRHLNLHHSDINAIHENNIAIQATDEIVTELNAAIDKQEADRATNEDSSLKAKKDYSNDLANIKEILDIDKQNKINNVVKTEKLTDGTKSSVAAIKERIKEVSDYTPDEHHQQLVSLHKQKIAAAKEAEVFENKLKDFRSDKKLLDHAGYIQEIYREPAKKETTKDEVKSSEPQHENHIEEPTNTDPQPKVEDEPIVIHVSPLHSFEIKSPLAEIYDAISTSHMDITGSTQTRDKDFSELISNPSNKEALRKATISYSFDTNENVWPKEIKHLYKKVKSSEALTDTEAEALAKLVPVQLTVNVNGKDYNTGLYYHLPSYVATFDDKGNITSSHLSVDSLEGAEAESRIRERYNDMLSKRKELVKLIHSNKSVASEGIAVTKGIPNYTEEQGNVAERILEPASQISIKVSDKGLAYVETNKTCDGSTFKLSLKNSKLTEEHANILFETLYQVFSGKGMQGSFEVNEKIDTGITKDDISDNLKLKDILDLLTVYGPITRYTQDNINRWGEKLTGIMRNKQLYFEDRAIKYGFNPETNDAYSIDIFGNKNIKTDKAHFIQWAKENKGYPVRNSKPDLLGGMKLNDMVKQGFKIGSWEYNLANGLKTMSNILISNPVGKGTFALTTNIKEYSKTGSLFRDPVAMLKNIVGGNIQFKTESKNGVKSTTKPIVQPKPNGSIKPTKVINGVEHYVITEANIKSIPAMSKIVMETIKDHPAEVGYYDGNGNVVATNDNFYDMGASTPIEVVKKEAAKEFASPIFYTKELHVQPASQEEITTTETEVVEQTESVESAKEEVPEVKVEEPKKESSDEIIAPFDDDLNDALGRSTDYSKGNYRMADTNKAINNLRKLVGNSFSIKIVDDYIKLAKNGKMAMATFTRDLITLSQLMEEGTEFHEAFHRVSQMLLTEGEHISLYEQARTRFATRAREMFGRKEWSNDELEEVLAEEFRSYMLKEEDKGSTYMGMVKKLFDKILNWINYYLLKRNPISSSNIDHIFESIAKGRFRYSQPRSFKYEALRGLEMPRLGIPEIDTAKQLESITKSLAALILINTNVDNFRDIKTISKSSLVAPLVKVGDKYEGGYINKLISNAKYQALNAKTADERNEWGRLANLYTAIINNFDTVFSPRIDKFLKGLGVSVDAAIDGQVDLSEKEQSVQVRYDENPVTIDQRDRALPAIKYLIATLKASDKPNEFSGLPELADFNESWRELLRELHSFKSFDDMIKHIDKMAAGPKNSTKWKNLQTRLNKADVLIQNQFVQVMNKHRHNYMNVSISASTDESTGETTLKRVLFFDTVIKNETNKLLNSTTGGQWGEAFSTSYVVERTTSGQNISVVKLKDVFTEYAALASYMKRYMTKEDGVTLSEAYDKIQRLFKKVGITIDNDTLDYIGANGEGSIGENINTFVNDAKHAFNNDSYLLLYAQYQSKEGRFSEAQLKDLRAHKLETALEGESIFRDLSKIYVKANIYKVSDMVIGPENSPFYVYSENNIVSDTIEDLHANLGTVNEKLGYLNNTNSYFLNHLKTHHADNNFRIETFCAFDDIDNPKEGGSEYVSINKSEDYLAKLAAVHSGYIPFPTLASKKMYYMYTGVPTLRGYEIYKDELTVPVNDLDVIYGYFKDEKARIAKVKRDVELATTEVDGKRVVNISNLVENVHYLIDKKSKKVLLHGDDKGKVKVPGSLFINFPSLNNTTLDLNNEILVKDHILNKIMFNLDKEIKFLVKQGILSKNEQGKVINNQLPTSLVVDFNKEVGNEHSIRAIVLKSMINQMVGAIETEKLISGEKACYKPNKKDGSPVEDFIKRLSALASTGASIVKSMNDKYDYDTKALAKETYKSKTLYSNVEESALIDDLKHMFTDIYTKMDKYSKDEIKTRVDAVIKPYKDCDNTDAQVFITPKMYRQLRMRLGEWSDQHQKSFELLTSDKELTLDDERSTREFFMEPLKFIYFGHSEPVQGGLDTVLYDKMSLATLFKRDIKGKQIEQLYNQMITEDGSGFDMLKFDTAVKAGNQERTTLFNKAGDIRDLKSLPSYEQPFKYLRRQLLTDPHEAQEQKLGSQPIKVALLNIQKEKEYEIAGRKTNGQDVINNVLNSLKYLSNNGRREVLAKFGITGDNILLKPQLLASFLRDEAEKGNMTQNILDALQIYPTGNFILSLDLLPNKDWISNRLLSYINKKTVDVNLPGGLFVQQSNVAYREVKVTEEDGKTKTEYSKDLKFYTVKENGKLNPMECKISASLFKNIIPNYSKLTFEQRKEWIKNNPELIGYRIPTQGQSSIVYMKVVDIFPQESGDIVMLPTEFTALTGSDFDIDKLYVINFNYSTDQHGNTVPTKFYNTKADSVETKATTEKELEDDGAFMNKYNTKLREAIRLYKNILDAEGLESFQKLNDEIHSHYGNVDKLDATINAKLEYIKGLKDQRSKTDDITKKTDINQEISSTYNQIDALREEKTSPNLEEAYIKLLTNKKAVLDELANDLISKGFFKSKLDFAKLSDIEKNTTKAVQNNLVNSMLAVLKSEHHLLFTTKPLDSLNKKLQDLAAVIDKKHDLGDMEALTPSFQTNVKQQYTSGKSGVAFPALHNVHHALAQAVNLGIKFKLPFGKLDEEGFYRLDQMEGADGQAISDWISALINAFVDIEKDPYIVSLNVNGTTYSATYFMLRLGLGESTFMFTSQPILKELAELDALSNGNITSVSNYGHAAAIVRKKYQSKLKATGINEADIVKLDLFDINDDGIADNLAALTAQQAELEDQTMPAEQRASYYYHQLKVLEAFGEFKKGGDKLQNLVNASQVDTKKFGSTPLENKQFLNRLQDIVEEGLFKNLDKLIPFDFNTNKAIDVEGGTHLGALLENSVILSNSLLNNKSILFTQGYEALRNSVSLLTGNQYSGDKKLINILGKEVYSTLMSDFFMNDKYLGIGKKDIQYLLMSDNSIANQIYRAKNGSFLPGSDERSNKINKLLLDNKLISDILIPEFSKEPNTPKFLKTFISKDSSSNSDVIIESFEDLFDSEYPELQKLGKDLLIYSYITSGFKYGAFSIFQYIPTSQMANLTGKSGMDFNNFLQVKLKEMQDPAYYTQGIMSKARDIVRNLWYQNSVVPVIRDKKTGGKTVSPMTRETSVWMMDSETEIEYPRAVKINREFRSLLYMGTNFEKQQIHKPFIKFRQRVGERNIMFLGEYIGYDNDTYEPIYKMIPKQSTLYKGIAVKEYGLSESAIFEGEIPSKVFKSDEELMNLKSFKATYPNMTYVPAEAQIVAQKGEITEEVEEVKEQPITEQESKLVEPTVTEYTPDNITKLKPNEVFVFGSNTEGRHGKGAALTAKDKFSAIYGQSEGLQGQSYAVITKDLSKGEKSIPLNNIGKSLQNLMLFAKNNPDKKFYVSKLGSSLAGYSVSEIKDLFEKLKNIIPDNVILPKEYEIREFKETNKQLSLFDKINTITDAEAEERKKQC